MFEALVDFYCFSADISANLKNKVPKAAAQKVLAILAGEWQSTRDLDRSLITATDKGSLTMKTYGKQTIFVYSQVSEPGLIAPYFAVDIACFPLFFVHDRTSGPASHPGPETARCARYGSEGDAE